MFVRVKLVGRPERPVELINMDLIECVAPHETEPEQVYLCPAGDDDANYLVEGSLGFWETLLRVGDRREYR